MIIYIDKEGRENIIRSDELIEKLIKENIITKNTLLKTEVAKMILKPPSETQTHQQLASETQTETIGT